MPCSFCKLFLVAVLLSPMSALAQGGGGGGGGGAEQVADLPEVRLRAARRPAQPHHRRARTASVRQERVRRSAHLRRLMSGASTTPATNRAAQATLPTTSLVPILPGQLILQDLPPAPAGRQQVRQRWEQPAIQPAERREVASTAP